MVAAAVVPLLVAAAVLVLDPPSVLVLGFAGPMLVLLLAVIGRRSAAATRRREAELGWLGSLYLDLLSGLGTLRGFGREHDAAEVIEESSRRFGDTTMEVLRTAFQTSLVMEWAATAATALVAVQVSFRLVSGSLDFATALAVLVLTPEFFLPLRRLALEYHTGQSAEAASRRIRATLGPRDGDGAAPAHGSRGLDLRATAPGPPPQAGIGVELQDVWLTRDGGRRAVLRGASMSIGAGEVVALIGESGVGKSSIAGLLLGFWSPDAGRVLVDGVDLGELDVTSWRRRVAWVPQSPTVFAGTVAHNIALGEPDASPHRIRRAAERAGLHEVIRTLPHGYDTVLGEGGRTLSGGERQRLAIARAVLRDAPLVVFDEFTAHLDPGTEQEVLDSARCLLQGRSALVIAHRPATVAMADRVVRMADGRVPPGPAPRPAGIPTDVAP
jgi:ABC-type transport system involved in cytochrome bd biosynthesis fused ATPase/permease subunit